MNEKLVYQSPDSQAMEIVPMGKLLDSASQKSGGLEEGQGGMGGW